MMGLTKWPYCTGKVVTWDNSIAMGYRLDLDNNFAWDKVVLNLPGTEEYYCQRS